MTPDVSVLSPAANCPHWFAIHTHPRQETRAVKNLSLWGVEIFAPCIRRKNGLTTPGGVPSEPLFPGYIFARFDSSLMLHNISFTRGVHSVLAFGGKPVIVHEEIIDLCRSRIGADGLVQIAQDFKPGENVVIQSGPFKNMRAVFEREMPDHERVSVLLNAVNFQPRVELYGYQIARTA